MLAFESRLASYWPLISNFAQRDLKSRYKRSLLGWIWSLVNPLALVATYSLVFGVVFRAAPPETANGQAETFALYLFTGLIVWVFFTTCLNGSMDWMQGVSDLRKKVYFPAETALLGGAIAAGVQSALEMTVLFLIMATFGNVSWTFLLYPLVLLGVASFGLGIGFFVAILNQMYRDVQYLVGVILPLLFFLVPIIYTVDIIPDRAYGLPVKTLISLNPISQFVAAGHDVVYFLRVPTAGTIAAMLVYSTFPFALGLRFFRRRSMAISEEA